MKKLLSLLAATGLIAGSLLATALPAQADDIVDVTAVGPIAVKDVVVSSKGCKVIRLSAKLTTDPVGATFDTAMAMVWAFAAKAKPEQGSFEALYATDSSRTLANTGFPEWTPLKWCPTKTKRDPAEMGDNLTGLGTFHVEGALVFWWNTLGDEASGLTDVDTGRTSFTVKQGGKVSSAKASKKGSTRTLSAKLTYFDVAKKAWKAQPKGTKVELQRRAANGSGKWKKVKTVKVGSKGAVKTTYKTKSTLQYRFVYAGSSTKGPVTSKTLKK